MILEAYALLRSRNGHLRWWPGRTRAEIIIGAILTQNTAWRNVEVAIARLRARGLLSFPALRAAALAEIEDAIRPSGYFRQKARKLKAFVAFLDAAGGGSLARLARIPSAELRDALLSTWGIGPETADSILLYAFKRPVFVIDAYTRRVAARHAWVRGRPSYAELQALFTQHLPLDVELYNDYHAQMVWVGKHHCGTRPRCDGCPLQPLLPLPRARSAASARAVAARPSEKESRRR